MLAALLVGFSASSVAATIPPAVALSPRIVSGVPVLSTAHAEVVGPGSEADTSNYLSQPCLRGSQDCVDRGALRTCPATWVSPVEYATLVSALRALPDPRSSLMITGLWQRGGGPSEMGFDELANARNDGATDFESDYSIQLIDDGGTVLASYPWDVEVDRQWGPYRYVPERVAIGVKVAFPLETARVRFVRSGTITAEFDPLSSALRDLVHALPDRAFVKNATERRTALLNKIDAFEKMIAKGDLKGADESLVHDIRDKVINWVVEVPILATPERTRSALLVQIASIDARLQKRLALSQKRH